MKRDKISDPAAAIFGEATPAEPVAAGGRFYIFY